MPTGSYSLYTNLSDHICLLATGNIPQRDTGVRRGRSLLARDQDIHESGLALFKRGATLRRKREQVPSTPTTATAVDPTKQNKRGCYNGAGPGGPWMTYCTILTACFPPFLLDSCGMSCCQAFTLTSDHLLLPRPSESRTTESMEREDGAHQPYPSAYGWCRFPHFRIHPGCLWETPQPLPRRSYW